MNAQKQDRIPVTYHGMEIGALNYFPVLDGWMFISILPASQGRHRRAAPLYAAMDKVRKRFPDARFECHI